MSARTHVLCVGDVMVDVIAELPGPLVIGSDVHAPIRYLPGGSAANTAAWLAYTGTPVTLIGRVGADAMGSAAREDVAAAGVVDHLITDPERPTGTCIVLVTPDGERSMIPDPGANAAVSADDLAPADFGAGHHLHVSGYALLGGARPAALAALARAREAGMTISIDAASAGPLADAGADEFLSWIGTDLLLFANAAEAEVLTGNSTAADAVRELASFVGSAVVKAGAEGAYWCERGAAVVFSPAHAIKPVDTTGAGDAFAAGFLAATLAAKPTSDALAEANRLAAEACLRIGGRPPLK